MRTHVAVSIIFVCRNPGPILHTGLQSVWSQTVDAFEIIVVDGESTDGTTEWLLSERGRIDTVITEADTGVYDAMNKGVRHASGDWVLFLGADDQLASPLTLKQVLPELSAEREWCAGSVMYEDGRLWPSLPRFRPAFRNFIHHQGCFYRRHILQANPYDASLQIQGDYDLNLRLLQRGAKLTVLPEVIARCGGGGLSDSGQWQNYREEIRIRHRHFSSWQSAYWDLGSLLRYLRKRYLRKRARNSPEERPSPKPAE